MKRGLIAAIILILLLIGLVIWMYRSALSRDTGIAPVGEMSEELSDALEGRVLVWSTMANVPLKFAADTSGNSGVLRSLGIPDFLRPVDLEIRRESVRDEWNLASVRITDQLPDTEVKYYTLDQGNFLNLMVSASGNCIVAMHMAGNNQNIVRFRTDSEEVEVVALSQSVDHWPSCNHNGSKILFHSYRDHNSGGDVYLAVEDDTGLDGWRVVRLTNRADVEYAWPKISADGNWCVAVERVIGQEEGRVIMWPLEGESLGDPVYITSDAGYMQYPSLNASGDICCWLENRESDFVIMLWSDQGSINGAGSLSQINTEENTDPDSIFIFTPMVTADGKFIVFNEINTDLQRFGIGIYDIEEKSTLHFVGSLSSFHFPSLSNPVGSDNE